MTTKASKFETSQWMNNLPEDSPGEKENKGSLKLQILDSRPQEESGKKVKTKKQIRSSLSVRMSVESKKSTTQNLNQGQLVLPRNPQL